MYATSRRPWARASARPIETYTTSFLTSPECGLSTACAGDCTFWPLGIDGENGVTLDASIEPNMSGDSRRKAAGAGGRWLDVRELRGATGRKILMRRPGG